MFANDTVVVPRESSWFWFFKDGSTSELVPYKETKLYTEDRIGLKSLDQVRLATFITHLKPGWKIEVRFGSRRSYAVYLAVVQRARD
jgi:hypothetical protein